MPDIDPHIDTQSDDGRPRKPMVNATTAHLFNSRVEIYLNGWTSPVIRAAVRAALEELGRDAHAEKHSRTENALKLARHLRQISVMLDNVAAGVQERASQETRSISQPS